MPHTNAEAERILQFLRHLGPDGFLVGPDGDIGALDVDDIFARPFGDLIADAVEFLAGSAFHDPSEERGLSRSILDPSLVFFENEAGLFLADRCRSSAATSPAILASNQPIGAEGWAERSCSSSSSGIKACPFGGWTRRHSRGRALPRIVRPGSMGIEGDAIARKLASRIPEVAEISIDLGVLAPRPGCEYSPGISA